MADITKRDDVASQDSQRVMPAPYPFATGSCVLSELPLIRHRTTRCIDGMIATLIDTLRRSQMEAIILGFAALGTIFGWAFFSFWSAIPIGLALNVSPFIVAITVTVSYGCGVALVVIVGAPLRERIRRRIDHRQAQQSDAPPEPNRMIQLVQRAWNRFGLIGLSLAAPMTVGAQVGAVIGLSFGARPLWLVIAMTLGAGAWGIVLTVAVVAGLITITQA